MSISHETMAVLQNRAQDFNNKYRSHFSYEGFLGKMDTLATLDSSIAANAVYRGSLVSVLKDAMIAACNYERSTPPDQVRAVDLRFIEEDFELYLMQPFVMECKKSGEPVYPQPNGGMTDAERLELLENVVNATPKNDVELVEKAYLSGNMRLRDLRESVSDISLKRIPSQPDLRRMGAIMLALEKINSERPLWWRVIHPFRNNAEQRDARDLKDTLTHFGVNVPAMATNLAKTTYKSVTLTLDSIKAAKTELEGKENNREIEKENVIVSTQNIVILDDEPEKTEIKEFEGPSHTNEEKGKSFEGEENVQDPILTNHLV